MVGADRTDDDRDRAALRRQCRSDEARGAIGAIARPVLGPRHGVADIDDPPRSRHQAQLERRHAGEDHDLAGQAARRGRPRIAERGQGQLLREGGQDLGRFRAAFPDGHPIGLDPHILEAQRGQLGDRPGACARLGFGSGQSLPDFGRQPLDNVPGGIVLQRGIAQLRHLRIDSGGHGRRGALGQGGRGKGGGGQGREDQALHASECCAGRPVCQRVAHPLHGREISTVARKARSPAPPWPSNIPM